MKILKQNYSMLISAIRISALVCLIISTSNALANGNSESLDGMAVLQESDNFLSLGKSFTFNVRITDSKDRNRELTVFIKERNKGLVKLLSPSSIAGRSFLFLNKNIWQYSASTGRAFRLHPEYQFLSGIDNLDLIGTGFSNYYKVQSLISNSSEIQLDLLALEQDTLYHAVVLKVNPKDYRPLQATFYLDSEDYLNDGKPKKTVFYENYRKFRNEDHPTQIRIVDHENNENETTMRFSLLRQTIIPDAWFSPQYLERFN